MITEMVEIYDRLGKSEFDKLVILIKRICELEWVFFILRKGGNNVGYPCYILTNKLIIANHTEKKNIPLNFSEFETLCKCFIKDDETSFIENINQIFKNNDYDFQCIGVKFLNEHN